MHHFLVGVFSRQISLCRNFHSKVGVGVISDVGVISVEYGTCKMLIVYTLYMYLVIRIDAGNAV